MDLRTLAGLLAEVRWHGDDRFSARCPAHDDSTASLAVRQTSNRLLIKCRGGCAATAVTAAIEQSNAKAKTSNNRGSSAHSSRNGTVPRADDDFQRRLPPQDMDAEQSVLGAILLVNESIEEALRIVKPTDFYREAHRRLYEGMVGLWHNQKPIDPVTLAQELRIRQTLEQSGGHAYVAELADAVPTAANIAHYAAIVRDLAVKRDLARKATAIAALAYDGVSLDALIGEAGRLINPIVDAPETELPSVVPDTVESTDWASMRLRRAARHYEWVVEGKLAKREVSSWAGKVEGGKTTLLRSLTMAVLRGDEFLDFPTIKGRVYYAMLDADGEDATYDAFDALGFNDDDSENCRFLFAPMLADIKHGFEKFIKDLLAFKPDLVVIDPYPRLKIIQDFHSYTNTYLMGQLSGLAVLSNAHLALPGHIPRAVTTRMMLRPRVSAVSPSALALMPALSSPIEARPASIRSGLQKARVRASCRSRPNTSLIVTGIPAG